MSTHTMHPDTLHALALVGQTVTYGHGMQGKVQSVEGPNYVGVDNDGQTEVTFFDKIADVDHSVLIIPTGRVMGQGYGVYRTPDQVRRGVSLDKRSDWITRQPGVQLTDLADWERDLLRLA